MNERAYNIHMRVTPAQHRAFAERANVVGLTISAWARMILLKQIRIDQKAEMEGENERKSG